MEKKGKKIGYKKWIAAFIILFIVLYAYIYVVPKVSDAFVSTYIAEYGDLEISDDSQVIFVRNENVYTADNSGELDKIVKQGNLKRKGSRVVVVGSQAYYSKEKGIISYYYDGYEDKLNSENISQITEDWLEKISEDYDLGQSKEESVQTGDRLFKIVDNQEWYLVFWVDKINAERFSEGKKVTVDFKDDTEIEMKITQVNQQGEKSQIVLACNRYYKYFDKYRIKDCRIITSKYSGILLENESIVEEDGKKGVYVVDKFGKYNFTPIKILGSNDEISVVEKHSFFDSDGKEISTVECYAEILRTNDKSKEKGSEENVD